MKFYSQYLFPFFLEWVLNRPKIEELRKVLLAKVNGDILEIGFGTGLNIQHYPHRVKKLTAVDIHPHIHKKAKKRIESSGISVDYRTLKGKTFPFADKTFDSLITTFTLCSIADVIGSLRECHRVLKDKGQIFFLEHGLSEERKIARWQNWFDPFQIQLGGGSHHLNRDVRQLLQMVSFKPIEFKTFYFNGFPKIIGYFYQGIAEKS